MSLAWELLYGGQTENAIVEFEGAFYPTNLVNAADDPNLRNVVKYSAGAILPSSWASKKMASVTINTSLALLPSGVCGLIHSSADTRMAIEQFGSVLKDDPDNLSAQWLSNIAMMTIGKYPAGAASRIC